MTKSSLIRILVATALFIMESVQAQYVHHQIIHPNNNRSAYSTSSVAFSSDGKILAFASLENKIQFYVFDQENGLWKENHAMKSYYSKSSKITFSPNQENQAIASIFSEGSLKIWTFNVDDNSWQHSQDLYGHTALETALAFSPSGQLLISGACDTTIRIWSSRCRDEPWICTHKLRHQKYTIFSLAFHPTNESLFVSGAGDKTITVWSFNDEEKAWQAIQKLTGHTNSVASLAFSPDGTTLVSASFDQSIKIWRFGDNKHWTCSQTLDQSLGGHTHAVSSIAFSSCGTLISSASFDKTTKLWCFNVKSNLWEIDQTFTEHTSGVTSVAFSPNGKFLVSSSYDNVVHVWTKEDIPGK